MILQWACLEQGCFETGDGWNVVDIADAHSKAFGHAVHTWWSDPRQTVDEPVVSDHTPGMVIERPDNVYCRQCGNFWPCESWMSHYGS